MGRKEDFLAACRTGDLTTVNDLLISQTGWVVFLGSFAGLGEYINPAENGNEALCLAVQGGHAEVVARLLNIPAVSAQSSVKEPAELMRLQKEINALFERLEARKSENAVPAAINEGLEPGLVRVTLEELQQLYDVFIKSRAEIQKTLLLRGGTARFSKEVYQLPRTVNVMLHPTGGDLAFIMEAKSKAVVESGPQAGDIVKLNVAISGASKSTKPAYRLDTVIPEKWANSVLYAYTKEAATNELMLELNLCQKLAEEAGPLIQFVHQLVLGPEILQDKGGSHRPNHRGFLAKRSIYSRYAQGDLLTLLHSGKLTNKDKKDITVSLLKGLTFLHGQGIVHQDIKPENILVYKNTDGNYYGVFIDYAHAWHLVKKKGGRRFASATMGYESPEMYGANRNMYVSPSYTKSIYPSLTGRISDNLPNTANDIWALGITLFQLYHAGKDPSTEEMKNLRISGLDNEISSLILGCLQPERSQRLTTLSMEVQKLINPIGDEVINSSSVRKRKNDEPGGNKKR